MLWCSKQLMYKCSCWYDTVSSFFLLSVWVWDRNFFCTAMKPTPEFEANDTECYGRLVATFLIDIAKVEVITNHALWVWIVAIPC